MARHEGLVVELGKGLAVVLTPDGQFRRVRAKAGWQLGEEVRLDNVVALPQRRRLNLTWVAAAAIILAMLLPGALSVRALFGQTALAAYVAVDINPSLELQVSTAGKVLAQEAVNDDAAQLLSTMDLRGLPLDQAVSRVTEKAVAAGFLSAANDNMVLITATPSKEGRDVPAGVAQGVQASRQAAQAVLKQHQLPNAVETLTAPTPVRDTARQAGLSTGKLLVASEAAAEGVRIDPQELKQEPLGKILSKQLKGNDQAGGNAPADGQDNRAAVSEFMQRVKEKDHGSQKDKVKAVDDFVSSWKNGKGDDKGKADDGKGKDSGPASKAPPQPEGDSRKNAPVTQPTAPRPDASATSRVDTVKNNAPETQQLAANTQQNADSRGTVKVNRGKGRKSLNAAPAGWQEQFREFFERIFGKTSEKLD